MTNSIRSLAFTALMLALLLAPAARAAAKDGLVQTQKAYADVDYERTRRLAKEALEQGGNDRATTGELYLMWGLAAAALEESEEAKSAFLHALAVNPLLKLDRGLSPRMRGPYLEARGSLTTADGKPPLEVSMIRRAQVLEVELRDKLGVAATLELGMRSADGSSFSKRRLPAASQRLSVPGTGELQVYVKVLDRHGNVLSEQGSANEPQRFLSLIPPRVSTSTSTPDVNRTPYLLTAGTLAVLGVVAGGVATAMYVKREDAAREWNGPGCERAGMTRAEQCADVDDRRRRAETLSVSFAAAGSALLVGSAVSLWLMPPTRRTGIALGAAPGNVVLRVGGAL